MRKRLAFVPAGDQTRSVCAHAATGIRRTLPKNFREKLSKPEYQPVREIYMRSFLLIAAAVLSFSATMTFETTEANAVVCARGVVRAGCASTRGAVVVRKPAVVCRTVVVDGVKVRRCT
jgi:hypothetical protein